MLASNRYEILRWRVVRVVISQSRNVVSSIYPEPFCQAVPGFVYKPTTDLDRIVATWLLHVAHLSTMKFASAVAVIVMALYAHTVTSALPNPPRFLNYESEESGNDNTSRP
ncbi:hypothetical protein PILCRDRAFT_823186 [Piloderma croceum F 1598]|uniref:Uncharacterized protein n=1 Tax=Piloderma croceum (strain F 1598) TaxID=765440 RepID=A0A0C3FJM4_PILCF|nr:hypothetical protein PILCRDRAFT_823186 [Piloderma croceum F 1598]